MWMKLYTLLLYICLLCIIHEFDFGGGDKGIGPPCSQKNQYEVDNYETGTT